MMVSRQRTTPPLSFYTEPPEMTTCRECGNLAVITDRYVLESTAGPVEHTVTRCSGTPRHTITVVD